MAANFARAQAPKGRPDADVLWNNDLIHLIGKKMGLYDKLDPGRVADLRDVYALVGITRTPASLVWGHLVITVPYVIRLVGAGLAGLDPSLERAAMSLGATPWRTFRAITLPLIGPGVTAGAAFAAVVSFDDVNIALFLASPRAPTLPSSASSPISSRPSTRSSPRCALSWILLTLAAIVVVERGIGLGRLFGADES